MRAVLCSWLAMVAWSASSYELNHYLGQSHAVDRAIVVALAIASCVHPGFTGAFLVTAWTMIGQLRYPLGLYAWADFAPLSNLSSLYLAALLLRTAGVPAAGRLLPVALAVHAAHYVHSGLAKIVLGWPLSENLAHFFRAHREVGWSAGIDDAAAERLLALLDRFSTPLNTVIVGLEISVVLILWRKRLAVTLLVALALMHLVTFALSGIFFWQWIGIDLGLAFACARLRPEPDKFSFGSRAWLVGSLVAMLTARLHLTPVALAWLDTRLQNYYRLEVTTASGSVFEVRRSEMAPYDGFFTQGRLQFLDDQKLLVDTYGEARDAATAAAVDQLSNAEQTARLELAIGHNRYEPARAERFDRFMQSWFRAVPRRRPWYTLASPPATAHASTALLPYDWKEPARAVRVRRIKRLWTGSESLVLNSDVIRRVTIH